MLSLARGFEGLAAGEKCYENVRAFIEDVDYESAGDWGDDEPTRP